MTSLEPKARFTLFLLSVFSLIAIGTMQAELVAHYPLDGTARDASTNALHGEIRGAPTPATDRHGIPGGAISLNGSSDYIDFGNPPAFNFSSNFTLACWARVDSYVSGAYLIAKYASTVPGPPNSYGLGFEHAGRAYAFVSHPDSGLGYFDIAGGPSLLDNRWHFTAVTYDRDFGIRLFLDGEQIGEIPAANAPPFTNSLPLLLGKTEFGPAFDGAIDNVEIYNHALTAAEIREVYNEPAGLTLIEAPKDVFVEVGTNAVFSITLGGSLSDALSYQWYSSDVIIPGATNATYVTDIFDSPGEGIYDVVVRLAEREWRFGPARLLVSPAGQLGLLAHWTFDDNFTTNIEEVTGRFPGQNTNGVRVPGFVGSGAIHLNGTNAHVWVGGINSPLVLTNNSYTISWWHRWDGARNSHQNIFAMDDGADFSGGYQAYIAYPQNVVAYLHSDGVAQFPTSFGFADQIWRFYAVTYDGARLKLYVDGVLVSDEERTRPIIQDGDDPLILGALALSDGTITNFFNGSLDDIRIYARPLSSNEIAALGPDAEIIILRQPESLRVAQGQTVTLRAQVTARGLPTTPPEFTYQWERDGLVLPTETNGAITVRATGGIQRYRVTIAAREIVKTSEEATVETVIPSGGELLLHLDFEDGNSERFVDKAKGLVAIGTNITLIPGRTGRAAARFSNGASLRIPAAGTPLELVGTGYTVAWWLAPDPEAGRTNVIYNIGPRDVAGYGVRLEGLGLNRALRLDHRYGANSVMNSPYRPTNWTHVAVVYDGQRRTVFHNGISTNTTSSAVAPLVGTGRHDLFIGADELGNTYNFGAVDDFRIYNYALAREEIAELVNPPPPSVSIHLNGQLVTIRLPRTEPVQFRLEQSASLGTNAIWQPLAPLPQPESFWLEYQHVSTNPMQFFRLRRL